MEWSIVIATVVGPIAAVAITLWYQKSDRNYQRKIAVFSIMMRCLSYSRTLGGDPRTLKLGIGSLTASTLRQLSC